MAKRNKKFADDGWAVWVDGDDTSTVYINDWLNPKGKSYVISYPGAETTLVLSRQSFSLILITITSLRHLADIHPFRIAATFFQFFNR